MNINVIKYHRTKSLSLSLSLSLVHTHTHTHTHTHVHIHTNEYIRDWRNLSSISRCISVSILVVILHCIVVLQNITFGGRSVKSTQDLSVLHSYKCK